MKFFLVVDIAAYIIAAVVLCPKFKPEMGFWKRILIMFERGLRSR